MTVGANPLTGRATLTPRGSGSLWTMPANDVRALASSLDRLGYDVAALLAAVGLQHADLGNPDTRIPCEALGALIARAQQSRFTPNLPLAIALTTPIGAYPLLDYLVLTSDTVGAGVSQLARYQRLIGNPVVLDIQDGADPIRVEMIGTPAAFSVEFVSSLMVLHFRAETGGRFAATSVDFRHQPDDVVAFEQALACRVHAKSDWNGVSIPEESWRLPLRRGDPVLRGVLESRAEDVLARLPQRTGLAHDVQRALTSRVAGGDTRIETIARELAVSTRTLQRRLGAEGVSYQELLDEARKEAAGRYIHEPTLAIGEIAYLVGYSEPAAFHRAFKRWYGATPDEFRKSVRR